MASLQEQETRVRGGEMNGRGLGSALGANGGVGDAGLADDAALDSLSAAEIAESRRVESRQFRRSTDIAAEQLPVEPLNFRSHGLRAAADLRATEPAGAEVDPQSAEIARSVAAEELLLRAHEAGREEGRQAARAEMQARLESERSRIARTIENFEREKQAYFAGLEQEVVQLSLAIAEKILHREAQMDPTLLAGAARVALEQVAGSSPAVLRVPPGEMRLWQERLGSQSKLGTAEQPAVELQSDPVLPEGECVLETRRGSVRLGIKAQLKEIERGFFELLGRRPQGAAAAL